MVLVILSIGTLTSQALLDASCLTECDPKVPAFSESFWSTCWLYGIKKLYFWGFNERESRFDFYKL